MKRLLSGRNIFLAGTLAGCLIGFASCGGEKSEDTASNPPANTDDDKKDDDEDDNDPDATTVAKITTPDPASYLIGDDVDFILEFSDTVTVTGTPILKLGGGESSANPVNIAAAYKSGSDSKSLVFGFTVEAGQFSPLGLTVHEDKEISLEGGNIVDSSGKDVDLSIKSIEALGHVKIVEGLVKDTSNGDAFRFAGDVTPPKSCKGYAIDARYAGDNTGEGNYVIKPAGTEVVAECVMVPDGDKVEGWTLVLSYSSDYSSVSAGAVFPTGSANAHVNAAMVQSLDPYYFKFKCEDGTNVVDVTMEEKICENADNDNAAGSGGGGFSCDVGTDMLSRFTSSNNYITAPDIVFKKVSGVVGARDITSGTFDDDLNDNATNGGNGTVLNWVVDATKMCNGSAATYHKVMVQ